MYFALWAVGAAATFLYGCHSKQEPDDKNSNTFRNRKISATTPLPKQAQSTRPYTSEFGNNLKAEQAFQKLRTEGVTPAQFDIGCQYKTSVIGKGNYQIEPCEVDEFLFANYQNYKKIFEGRTQTGIPWEPGKNAGQRVQTTIDYLKNNETLKKFPPSSVEYQERLATALLHFALVPDHPEYLKSHHSEWQKKTSPLKSIGLEDFQKKLLTEGGLGVALWKNDNQGITDGTTSHALQTKIGSDIAKNHLLFSIFEQAKLKPFFAKVNLTEPHEENIQQGKKIPVYRTSLFFVGISPQKQQKIFSLTQPQAQETYKNYDKLSLKIYYSYYLSWRGVNATMHARFDQATEFLDKALEFNPKSHTAYNNYGVLLMEKGKKEDAELAFKKSIDLKPDYALAYENLGDLYWGDEKTKEALQVYYKAVLANPQWMKNFSKDKLFEKTAQVLKKDPDDTIAKSIRRKLESISLVIKK